MEKEVAFIAMILINITILYMGVRILTGPNDSLIKFMNNLRGVSTKITKGTRIYNRIAGGLVILISLYMIYDLWSYLVGNKDTLITSSLPYVLTPSRFEVFFGILLILQGLGQLIPFTRKFLIKIFNVMQGQTTNITSGTVLWSKISGIVMLLLGLVILYSNLVSGVPLFLSK